VYVAYRSRCARRTRVDWKVSRVGSGKSKSIIVFWRFFFFINVPHIITYRSTQSPNEFLYNFCNSVRVCPVGKIPVAKWFNSELPTVKPWTTRDQRSTTRATRVTFAMFAECGVALSRRTIIPFVGFPGGRYWNSSVEIVILFDWPSRSAVWQQNLIKKKKKYIHFETFKGLKAKRLEKNGSTAVHSIGYPQGNWYHGRIDKFAPSSVDNFIRDFIYISNTFVVTHFNVTNKPNFAGAFCRQRRRWRRRTRKFSARSFGGSRAVYYVYGTRGSECLNAPRFHCFSRLFEQYSYACKDNIVFRDIRRAPRAADPAGFVTCHGKPAYGGPLLVLENRRAQRALSSRRFSHRNIRRGPVNENKNDNSRIVLFPSLNVRIFTA